MSNRYKHGDRVPSDVLCNRLNELADAVTEGQQAVAREFTMRIPAEMDRDADLVLSQAAKRISELEATLTQQQGAEPDGYMYEFVGQFSGAPVWRQNSGEWNGQRPKSSRPYFFHPPKPAAQPASVATRDRVMDAVADALGGAYDCSRVWEAWSYGTMGQDDFELVSSNINRLAEIADAAIGAMAAQPQVPKGFVEAVKELNSRQAAKEGGK